MGFKIAIITVILAVLLTVLSGVLDTTATMGWIATIFIISTLWMALINLTFYLLCDRANINRNGKLNWRKRKKLYMTNIVAMATIVGLDIVGSHLGSCPVSTNNTSAVLSWLDPAFFCATFPNIVAGVFVALAGAGALLYPIHQQREKIRSRNRVLIDRMCQLTTSEAQTVLGATKLPHIFLPVFANAATMILAFLAVCLYIATVTSFKATFILVSLIMLYLFIVIYFITSDLLSNSPEPDHDTTTTALSLLLSAAIKTPQNPSGAVVVHADSLELYQEVKSKLSNFIENAGTYATGVERLYNFKLIDKVVEDESSRTLTVYPFTGDKELGSKVLIGFKHLLHKHGTALDSKSSAVNETVLAISRHALLKDCRLLVQAHLPNLLNSEQEALAIFLTLCGNSYINNPTKETIKKLPSTNQTVESLGIYFKLDADPCWYTLSEINIYDKLNNCK